MRKERVHSFKRSAGEGVFMAIALVTAIGMLVTLLTGAAVIGGLLYHALV